MPNMNSGVDPAAGSAPPRRAAPRGPEWPGCPGRPPGFPAGSPDHLGRRREGRGSTGRRPASWPRSRGRVPVEIARGVGAADRRIVFLVHRAVAAPGERAGADRAQTEAERQRLDLGRPKTARSRYQCSESAPNRTLSKKPTSVDDPRRKKVEAGLGCWNLQPQRRKFSAPVLEAQPFRPAGDQGRDSLPSAQMPGDALRMRPVVGIVHGDVVALRAPMARFLEK